MKCRMLCAALALLALLCGCTAAPPDPAPPAEMPEEQEQAIPRELTDFFGRLTVALPEDCTPLSCENGALRFSCARTLEELAEELRQAYGLETCNADPQRYFHLIWPEEPGLSAARAQFLLETGPEAGAYTLGDLSGQVGAYRLLLPYYLLPRLSPGAELTPGEACPAEDAYLARVFYETAGLLAESLGYGDDVISTAQGPLLVSEGSGTLTFTPYVPYEIDYRLGYPGAVRAAEVFGPLYGLGFGESGVTGYFGGPEPQYGYMENVRRKLVFSYAELGVTQEEALRRLPELPTAELRLLCAEHWPFETVELAVCPKLAALSLGSAGEKSPLCDLSALAGCPELLRLSACNASVSDLSPLAGLPLLEQVSLCDNLIADPSPLGGAPALYSAELGGNRIRDARPLTKLIAPDGLCWLDLHDNPLERLGSFERDPDRLFDLGYAALHIRLDGTVFADRAVDFEIAD